MTPQDQEEHRLAALAAGYDSYFSEILDRMLVGLPDDDEMRTWAPKTNKSDSFDLMVACHMMVSSDESEVEATGFLGREIGEVSEFGRVHEEDASIDRCAMLAIFRCAVEIGRAKEQSK